MTHAGRLLQMVGNSAGQIRGFPPRVWGNLGPENARPMSQPHANLIPARIVFASPESLKL